LLRAGDHAGAAAELEALLAGLPPRASFERVATLGRLGRCQAALEQTDAAIARFHEALESGKGLDNTQAVAHMIADLHVDLGDAHRRWGALAKAQRAYEAALTTYARNGEPRLAAHAAQRLAQVCEALGEGAAARDARHRARRLYGQSPQVQEALAAYAPFIEQAVAGAVDPARLAALEPLLAEGEDAGWTAGIAAVRRIVAGDRDEDALCAGLDLDDQQVIWAILQALGRAEAGLD
jgi:tetratricopeptide (TPR) repeat protein